MAIVTCPPACFQIRANLRQRARRATQRLAIACIGLVAAASHGYELRFAIAELERGEWTARGIAVQFDLARESLSVRLDSLSHAAVAEPVRDLEIHCDLATLRGSAYACDSGSLEATHDWIGAIDAELRVEGDLAASRHRVSVSRLRLLGSEAVINVLVEEGVWRVRGNVRHLDVPIAMAALRNGFGDLPRFDTSGSVDVDFDFRATGGRDIQGSLSAKTGGIGLDSADGSVGVESLGGSASVRVRVSDTGVGFEGGLDVDRGELFVDPVYLQAIPSRPISLSTKGIWTSDRLTLDSFSLEQVDFADVSGSVALRLPSGRVEDARVVVNNADVGGLYSAFLESHLDPQGVLGLSVAGKLDGEVQVRDGEPIALVGQLRNGTATDTNGLFLLEGFWADAAWSVASPGDPVAMGWNAAEVHGIPLGEATVRGQTTESGFRLTEATRVPLLGGEFTLESMAADTGSSAKWRFESRISGVVLSELSAALGWPPMSGDLSAVAPRVDFADDVLTVRGAVLIRAFSGTVTATRLSLERPLGPAPLLRADVLLKDLDLHELTQTFSFGNIEGRVGGEIRDLELIDWSPTRFDAYLGTPEGFSGRRRISQTAVNELAAVGGGPAASLSKGMLGIFEQFPYRRLGIGCKLERGVCTMRGVAPAKRGYYLVEGRGLPRIDVIGFADQVDWEVLVARLVAATRGGVPVVE